MATVYTHGVKVGSVRDFKSFAKKCMEAFSGDHQIQQSLSDAIEYDKQQLERLEKEKQEIENKTDKELVDTERENIQRWIDQANKYIEENKEEIRRLNDMLDKVEKFKPPTEEHRNFKSFMVQQLKDTIHYENLQEEYENDIKNLQIDQKNINPNRVRGRMLRRINKEILYHKQEIDKQKKSKKDNSKWIAQLEEAIEQHED